jgi:hypothetical protein
MAGETAETQRKIAPRSLHPLPLSHEGIRDRTRRSAVTSHNLTTLTKPRHICTVLGYYASSSGNPVPTFRNNVSVPSSRIKKSRTSRSLKMGPTSCRETPVKYYHSELRNIPEESIDHQHGGGSLKSRLSHGLFPVIGASRMILTQYETRFNTRSCGITLKR